MEEPKTQAQHIVPYEDAKWAVRAQNSQQPSKVFDTKIEAVSYGFDLANKHDGMIVIHNRDGTFKDVKVTEENSKFLTLLTS